MDELERSVAESERSRKVGERIVRVAAVSDIHCKQTSDGAFRSLFSEVVESADIFLICGDLTDYGLPEEAQALAKELEVIVGKIPVLAVLGNHDYECGKQGEVRQILSDAGVVFFDGNSSIIQGIGFTGVKGFAGGFGDRALQPWGEESIKRFVGEGAKEAVKLESGLAKLDGSHRIALLHYAPIRGTVEGEPLEVFPFLGSTRLEEPLNRYSVTCAFHGHAHRGYPEGRTRTGVPVYNVSISLLKKFYPDRPPFRVVEVVVLAEGDK